MRHLPPNPFSSSVRPTEERFTTPLPALWRRKHLSPAEQRVVVLVASGLPNKLVAAELHKSTFTVRNQLQRALHKLGLNSRYELIAVLHRPEWQTVTRPAEASGYII